LDINYLDRPNHITNPYDFNIMLNNIELLYNYEDNGLNNHGTTVLGRWGFVSPDDPELLRTGPEDPRFIGKIIDENKLNSFKYIIDIAKIHLSEYYNFLDTLERRMGGRVIAVQYNYESFVNYFKITIADFLKVGFLSKFFERDVNVYRDSRDSYNKLVEDTVREQGPDRLWHVGISMEKKVRDLFKQNSMPGRPDFF
jgi:hypothetical protein